MFVFLKKKWKNIYSKNMEKIFTEKTKKNFDFFSSEK